MRRAIIAIAAFALVSGALAVPVRSVSAQQPAVSEGQKLALYTKPSVVRIADGYAGVFVDGNGQQYPQQYIALGSGAFIDSNGYIITNAHVTDLTHKGEDAGKDLLLRQLAIQIAQQSGKDPSSFLTPSILSRIADLVQLKNFQHIHHVICPNGDAFPFEIKAFGAPVGEGKDVSVIKIEVKNAPVLKIGDSDKLQLQDHVTVVGYPGAADTFDTGLLDAKSALEASITDGKLSAKKNSADGAPILQISAPATHGNSGGPVLTDSGEEVGLLTFGGDTVKGQEISGFVFVVPSSTMLEFVRQSGANNQQGIIDQKYREGLDAYWNNRYTEAIAKFEEVQRLFPQHSETGKLIQQAQQAKAEGKEASALPIGWIAVGGGAILVIGFLLVVGLIVGFVLMRKKKPAASAPAPSAAPHAPTPAFQPQAPPMAFQPPMPAAQPGSDKTMAISAATVAAGYSPGASQQAGLGALVCTSGALAGQRFDIRPEGIYIGREGALSQVVIADGRVSKRHVWVGPRNGRVVVVDQQSTNGTFLNVPNSQRISEVALNPGDTIILSEADVARFQYTR